MVLSTSSAKKKKKKKKKKKRNGDDPTSSTSPAVEGDPSPADAPLSMATITAASTKAGVLHALKRAGVPHLLAAIERRRHPDYLAAPHPAPFLAPLKPNPLYPIDPTLTVSHPWNH